jgi:hypothetical protein
LYRSYWHYRFSKNRNGDHTACYYTARQNPGAGIGHQMSNWLAGYWFARQFGLKFAHVPFPDREWEDFLGFGDNEERVKDLVKSGYRIRRLPLFEEHNPDETELIKAIIRSYSGKRVVFIAELDQFHRDLYSVMDDIRHKFHNAKARQSDRLIYSKEDFNIAVHVRRGDIVAGALAGDEGMLMRWQDNDYFVNVLSQILKIIHTGRHIVIHLFSQGKIDDFREFGRFENMQFHLDMNPLDSFLHMVHADLLVTGKSSFSYKPALLNKGIKLCPRDFWHGYPDDPQWILAESNGLFDANRLKSINL